MQASIGFKSVDDFTQWSEGYFKHPTPERVPAALSFCASNGLVQEVNFNKLGYADSSAVFKMSQIFLRHPEQVWEWVKACREFEDRSQKGVMQALWIGHNDACKKALQKFADSTWRISVYAADLLAKKMIFPAIGEPLSFHLVWSMYYVSGDFRTIGLLIDAIPLLNEKPQNEDKVRPIVMSLIRHARVDQLLSDFIVQHCRAHASSADHDLQLLIRELGAKPRQSYSVEQLFPAQPDLKAEVKAKAANITNIVFGIRLNHTLQQAQIFAQEQYRGLTGNLSGEAVSQMLFMMGAEGVDDQGLAQIAGSYGFCIKKKKNGMFTDTCCERIPTN